MAGSLLIVLIVRPIFLLSVVLSLTFTTFNFLPPANAQIASVMNLSSTTPEPDAPITDARKRALKLFEAVTGIPVPIDDQRLKEMEPLVAAGKDREAVKLAVRDPLFFDIRLRDMARKMSVRDESIRAPISDFVATIVGAARDGLDARELLTGNFTYQADTTKTMSGTTALVRAADFTNSVTSNNHYDDIQNANLSLFAVLKKVDGQVVTSGNGATTTVPNPDPAGLITTRAFMLAHATAGTNRRLVEHSFRQFMCVSMEEWMDGGRPDDMVGRDVDRFPGGSNEKYQVSCKSCHGQMDGFRQAFAYVDFNDNKIVMIPGTVTSKMASNRNVFPEGFETKSNAWVNYATEGKNADRLVLTAANRGTGIKEFGNLLAQSKGFSRCLTKRFFTSMCKRLPASSEESLVRSLANEFEQTYKLIDLAELVVSSPACVPR